MKCCENVEHEISGVLALWCDSVSCHFIPGHGLTMATGPHPGAGESWAMIYSSHCKLLTAGLEHWTLDCPLRMWHCITQDDFSDEYTTVHCWTSHPPGIMTHLMLSICSIEKMWWAWLHNVVIRLHVPFPPVWKFYEIGWSKSASRWKCPASLFK